VKIYLRWLGLGLVAVAIALVSPHSFAQMDQCTNNLMDTFTDQRDALNCCLTSGDQKLQEIIADSAGGTCPKDVEYVDICRPEPNQIFRSTWRSRVNGGACGTKPWSVPSDLKVTSFAECPSGEPVSFSNSSGGVPSGTTCIDGCSVNIDSCVCVGDGCSCGGVTTGQVCDVGSSNDVDQCQRDPTRPECVCSVNGGAPSLSCMCAEDPLVFGDVAFCDSLNNPPPPPTDSDGDGQDNDSDPCPFDATNNCSDNPDADTDGDGQDNGNDPCPLDRTNSCETSDPEADNDGDGVPNGDDPCPSDATDSCNQNPNPGSGGDPGDPTEDPDGDGNPNGSDPCPFDASNSCGVGGTRVQDADCSALPACDDPGGFECTQIRQQWRARCDLELDLGGVGDGSETAIWDDPLLQDFDGRADDVLSSSIGEVFDPPDGVLGGSCPEISSVIVAGTTLDFPDATLCSFLAAAGWVVVAFSIIVGIRIVVGGL